MTHQQQKITSNATIMKSVKLVLSNTDLVSRSLIRRQWKLIRKERETNCRKELAQITSDLFKLAIATRIQVRNRIKANKLRKKKLTSK
jgi:hypothetical protein